MNAGMRVGLTPWCGRPTGYRDHKCRCYACTESAAKAGREWRRRRYAERQKVDGVMIHPLAPHGYNSGYRNWGCRCPLCLRAKKVHDYSILGKQSTTRPPRRKVHGTVWGYRRGCRCTDCGRASREQMRRDRAKRFSERVLVDGRLVHPRARHGTTRTAYSYYGCRCRPCVRFNYEKTKEASADGRRPELDHGTGGPAGGADRTTTDPPSHLHAF